MFGRSDFTNKIPPKFNSKINPRLKPSSNNLQDNQNTQNNESDNRINNEQKINSYQNDPFANSQNSNNNTLTNNNSTINTNNSGKLNSVQKSQHTFGSAFGPDTKKQDFSEIKGELNELSGNIGQACE